MTTPVAAAHGRARIILSGVLDGSRAMEIAHLLRSQGVAPTAVDFTDVERFEPFGVDVLLRELAAFRHAEAGVRCCGLPPCVAEQMGEIGIAVDPATRHPRWAPWAR